MLLTITILLLIEKRLKVILSYSNDLKLEFHARIMWLWAFDDHTIDHLTSAQIQHIESDQLQPLLILLPVLKKLKTSLSLYVITARAQVVHERCNPLNSNFKCSNNLI